MSYKALYRTLRPKSFADVVGQEHIVRTLKNQIINERISHAYLLCGTRGTGKTSTAKVFAQAVNCLDRKDGEPCHCCQMCVDIADKKSFNVIEIDAASNNGVENIRDLREEVKYPPTEGFYKVYIIDEVHMLSTGAFNALLKTLEEPPVHVIFILATTDPQKVPPTIQSRCQRFDFRRISAEDITSSLSKISQKENIDIELNAIKYIAALAEGAMRDALSLLDQCISFHYGEHIAMEMVQGVLGTADKSYFFMLVDALKSYDSQGCLEIINKLIQDGKDVSQFVTELIDHLRNLLVAKAVGENGSSLNLTIESYQRILSQSKDISQEALISYINTFSGVLGQIKYSGSGRILFEIACIKACNPQAGLSDDQDNLKLRLERLEKLEERLTAAPSPLPASAPSHNEEKKTKPEKKPKAAVADFERVKEGWSGFVDSVKQQILLKQLLAQAKPEYINQELLYILVSDKSSLSLLNRDYEEVSEKLNTYFNRSFSLKTSTREDFERLHKGVYNATSEEVDIAQAIAQIEEAYPGFLNNENVKIV